MNVPVAALVTETNAFTPVPTGYLSFEAGLIVREVTRSPADLFTAPISEFRTATEALGWNVVENPCANTNTAGATFGPVSDVCREQVLSDIKANMPDICLVSIHGAMTEKGYDDTEFDTSIIPLIKRDHDYWPRVDTPAVRTTSGRA